MRRSLVLGLVMAFLVVMAAGAMAAPYKSEYKMSVVVGPKLPWGEGAQKFADLVRERTNGRINIKVYTAASLMAGKQTNEFMILRRGVADFAFASTINWSSTIKELNLFNLPFFFPDYEALDRVTEGEVGRDIGKMLERKGVILLAWGENGFRELTNSKRPIRRPEDLKGLKIRVVGTPIFIDIMKALGANPVNMNWAEAKVAFQQGVVDGQENPVVSILIPVQIWQFHKYITIWHYVIDPLMLTVNAKVFKSFTPEDRKIVMEAAREAANEQRARVRKGLIPPDLSALDVLKAHGMEVTILTPEERARFKEKTKPVYDRWVKKIGPELVEKARRAVEGK